MNTSGHHGVAEDAGIPLLQDAFGKDERSLGAFYLGNWLTDVSQAVDPVAYASLSGKAKSAGAKVVESAVESMQQEIDRLAATLIEDVETRTGTQAGELLRSLKPDLAPYAEEAKRNIAEAVDVFLAAKTDERSSAAAMFMRSVFLLNGYFRFVHPEAPGDAPRLDFPSFMRVFGRPTHTRGATGTDPAIDRPGAFTQYFPYEHLDRPELLPAQDPPVFAPGPQTPERPFRVAPGAPPAGPRSPRRRERVTPDLYSYLRDDLERTAGLLAEVDIEFERAVARGISDTDPAWHLTLAKLGHALHQVEDFFAHSNWVELAVTRLGPDVMEKVLPPELGPDLLDRARTTYSRRLKRLLTKPLTDWRTHPDEDWVVTGTFDFRDTAVSLSHLSEEGLGLHVPDPWAKGHELYQDAADLIEKPRTTEHQARKLLRDTLDFVTDPERALADRDNEVAASLEEEYGKDVTRIIRPGVPAQVAEQVARETPLLQSVPPEIQQAFFTAIVEGGRVYTIGTTARSLYGTIRSISDFLRNPYAWLLDFLPGWLAERVKDAGKFYAKELFYDKVGADRIGCHSLLAKDHGLEPFYKHQRECATAVHWYVVKTLLRWQGTDGAAPTYIDWLELVEYFCRNPLPPQQGSFRTVRIDVPITVIHVTEAGDQLDSADEAVSLAKRYRRTSFRPGQFSWRTIADANFATGGLPVRRAQDVVNHTLRDRAWGYAVTPPNFAFQPGIRLLIPGQRAQLVLLLPPQDDPTWFREVIDKGWEVFTGFEDPEAQMSVPPLQHHTPIPISRAQIDLIVRRGQRLRREARDAYRPPKEQ